MMSDFLSDIILMLIEFDSLNFNSVKICHFCNCTQPLIITMLSGIISELKFSFSIWLKIDLKLMFVILLEIK